MTESRRELAARRDAITAQIQELGQIVVAFSGGVDSSLVAALAFESVGDGALAVTAVSETLGGRELEDAQRIAAEIGIRHELVTFSELDDDRFVANDASRCYFCQSMRFDQLRLLAETVGCDVLASGTNYDDLGDHRPGLRAMEQRRIYQPLLEHRITKSEVRQLARDAGLSAWNKPAKACLSSRIPHGISVTNDRLRRIEQAEDVLDDLDFREYRVRDHNGVARIEVATAELDRLLVQIAQIGPRIRAAGFKTVTVDLSGFRSGSLNPVRRSD